VSQGRRGAFAPLLFVAAGLVGGYFAYDAKGVATGVSVLAAGILVAVAVGVFRDPPPPKAGGADAAAINFGK